jgi:hypothetical protein
VFDSLRTSFEVFSLLLIEVMDQVDPSLRQWLMRNLTVPDLKGLTDPIQNGVPPLLLRNGHIAPTHPLSDRSYCEAYAVPALGASRLHYPMTTRECPTCDCPWELARASGAPQVAADKLSQWPQASLVFGRRVDFEARL